MVCALAQKPEGADREIKSKNFFIPSILIKIHPVLFQYPQPVFLNGRPQHIGSVGKSQGFQIKGYKIICTQFLIVKIDDLVLEYLEFFKPFDRNRFSIAAENI